MKAVVTGGTGFIGSHLTDRLVKEGFHVTVPVRKGSNTKYLPSESVEIREMDLLDAGNVTGLLKNADLVFHLASIRGSGWSYDDTEIFKVNVGITRNLLEASVSEKVSRFVYLSSVSVYGHPRGGPVLEDYKCFPVTRYGKTKHDSEMLVRDFSGKHKISATILRPVITYGPRDTWGMIPKLIRMIHAGSYLTVGSGENRVHLIYIDDLIEGIMRTASNPVAVGSMYILSGEVPVTINNLVEMISSNLNKRVPGFHVPLGLAGLMGYLMEFAYRTLGLSREPFLTRDKVDIMCRDRFFSNAKAKEELGFTPAMDCRRGLETTMDWMLSTQCM